MVKYQLLPSLELEKHLAWHTNLGVMVLVQTTGDSCLAKRAALNIPLKNILHWVVSVSLNKFSLSKLVVCDER